MMSIHKLIKTGRIRLGMTEKEFADAVGVSRGAVQQWEKEGEGGTAPKRKNQPAVAKLLGVSVAELMGGSNVEPGAFNFGDIPLISLNQALALHDSGKPPDPGEIKGWISCHRPHSKSTYALTVKGDGMFNPLGPKSYPEGCIIIIDPDRRTPNNGQRIIARLEDTGQLTFKTFKEEDGRRWLMPLNPSHLPIRDPFQVVGTVIAKWEDED